MHLPFFVDDNTGRLLVDPRGADLDLHRDFEQEFSDSFFSSKDPVPDTVRSFLARHGIVTNNKLKVEEFCIKPKNSLFILGTLAENPGIEVTPQPTRDEEAITSISSHGFSFSLNSISPSSHRNDDHFNIGSLAERLAMQSAVRHEVVHLSPDTGSTKTADMTQQQKIAAALMKAGISNPAAWSAAGVPTSSNALPVIVLTETAPAKSNTYPSNVSSSDQANGFVLHPPVVLRKGTNNKTFLISWRSQNQLARSLGWKCTLMIWGGPALALLSLYFFMGIKNLF